MFTCLKSKSKPLCAAVSAALLCACSGIAGARDIDAGYETPDARYPHGVFGRDFEYKSIYVNAAADRAVYVLPDDDVFEDLAPRGFSLAGTTYFATVVSNDQVGAALVIFQYDDAIKEVARAPAIGQGRRWLAPVGIGDLDGDGQLDISYVETPHIHPRFRLFNFDGETLVENERASFEGLSNHRFGEEVIQSAAIKCEQPSLDVLVMPEKSFANDPENAHWVIMEFEKEQAAWRREHIEERVKDGVPPQEAMCGAL